ncbi:hypothetical protein F5Y13DRAFT_206024 [Hypoxylon sp. FL1857]|nr:hypothetical protein F5Y13DRAFT_206024 [Hypoxylon sp. FL1857]
MAYRMGLMSSEGDFRRPFKEYRERRREASKKPAERSGGHKEGRRATDNHRVWIPEVYYDPRKLAKKEPYGRVAEAAPPVSSSRWNKSSIFNHIPRKGRKEKRSQEHKQRSSRSHRHDRYAPTKSIPAYNHSQPPKRPVRPAPTHHHQRHRDVVGNRAPMAPAPEPLPPHRPPLTRRGASNWPQAKQHVPHAHPPAPKPAPIKHPTLRRVKGQVYKIAPPRPAPATVPLPAYQEYLNALRSAPSNSTLSTGPMAQLPGPRPPSKRKKESYAKEESAGSFLRRVVGFGPATPDSGISDISFACQDSVRLTNESRSAVSSRW